MSDATRKQMSDLDARITEISERLAKAEDRRARGMQDPSICQALHSELASATRAYERLSA